MSPWTTLMEGDLESSFCAEAESGALRVTARMVKSDVEVDGAATRESMVAPPCFPVAPRIRRDLLISNEKAVYFGLETCEG